MAHGYKTEKLVRPRQNADTTAVLMLAEVYVRVTGRSPTRGGKDGPSQFECFLKEALGDLTKDEGTALAKRWQRVWQNAVTRLGQASNRDHSEKRAS
jgi:hypothetical protein